MRVMLGMPHGGSARLDAMTAFREPVGDDSTLTVTLREASGPEPLMNHNSLWAQALDAFEAGEIDAFAMIHADVAAEPGWLDKLYAEMRTTDADVISAVIPIKNNTGLTSTAVDDTGDPMIVRRLTMREIERLPTTFGDAEVGGPILLNTGLWLARLGPWCLREEEDGTSFFCFELRHRIRRNHNGKRYASLWPDDWELSRRLHSVGLKLQATTAAMLIHHGEQGFPNFGAPWGWGEDIQNGPNAPWRIAQRQGFGLDANLAGKLARTPDGKTRTIAKARMDGSLAMLVFSDGATACMANCTAL